MGVVVYVSTNSGHTVFTGFTARLLIAWGAGIPVRFFSRGILTLILQNGEFRNRISELSDLTANLGLLLVNSLGWG